MADGNRQYDSFPKCVPALVQREQCLPSFQVRSEDAMYNGWEHVEMLPSTAQLLGFFPSVLKYFRVLIIHQALFYMQ